MYVLGKPEEKAENGRSTRESIVDPAMNAIGNEDYGFLSESRLKSTGSIKSDVSVPEAEPTNQENKVMNVADIQFGYFSSSTGTSMETSGSPEVENEKVSTEKVKADPSTITSSSPSEYVKCGTKQF